jgi:uncharacterized pyridoxamine 5'-phosphate oxidase family protein
MELLNDYLRIVDRDAELALATCAGGEPNVRIVNFVRDTDKTGVLYFATFPGNPKVAEFERNDRVAFTTIPKEGTEHARSQGALVVKSSLSMTDLAAAFVAKIPGYAEMIDQAGDALLLYELRCDRVSVILDPARFGELDLCAGD